ncbi:single-stranded-DNA-specific exonuclease RecJ [Polluticaenibacter yanchengensis]|uniref:Single-stranded-DNA-specific exonuclease RecJ n=1 Tax=Polluticaenibacter yanchengensis TaxID=3014562 RepID=A0ABT4UPQ6_9BACT|nr:single-stranded-DNA-specific exonuclease RecJ [Chitinophagaceae bacterium LY-5]
MDKRWKILKADQEKVATLSNALKINPAICKILVQRGLEDFEQSRDFFRPKIGHLHSPWLMKDMDKAVERITRAITNNEKILVYGDYDVDGTTSVACMYQFLKSIYPNVDFYIPHRYKEGYGISVAGIEFARDNQFSLIVSLDCGIKAINMIALATAYGIDFVVCDHHTPDDILPEAYAILNPKQKDCPYPFNELCGCGVGFKLIQALCETLNLPDETWMQYMDLLATAIAADIVPLVDENRTMTYFGLKRANENPSVGIKALLELAQKKDALSVSDLVFLIAPRVNAAGRMDDAKLAVRLFIEKDYKSALELAEELQVNNTDRKETDAEITQQALELIETNTIYTSRKSTVLYKGDWHKGVVGIVASRLIEKHYKPTIILTNSNDKISGSARSVIGFNVYEAIHSCKDLLENYGGHFYAAGLTLKPENLDLFIDRFETVVSGSITEEMLSPEIVIDTEINFADITETFYNIILQMEPYGPENMRPVFITRNVYETGMSRIVKEAHIKFSLKHGSNIMNGIGFGLADKFELLQPNRPIDIVYTLDINVYRDVRSIQLKVLDIKASNSY